MRRRFATQSIAFLGRERGALLWVPSVLIGTSLILFGIHQAPRGMSLFTRTTGERLVVEEWTGPGSTPAEQHAFTSQLRHALLRHGALAVIDSARVARRVREASLQTGHADSTTTDLAIRALNPHLVVRGRLQVRTAGVVATLEARDGHTGEAAFETAAAGATFGAVASALAESVGAHLYSPATARSARGSGPPP